MEVCNTQSNRGVDGKSLNMLLSDRGGFHINRMLRSAKSKNKDRINMYVICCLSSCGSIFFVGAHHWNRPSFRRSSLFYPWDDSYRCIPRSLRGNMASRRISKMKDRHHEKLGPRKSMASWKIYLTQLNGQWRLIAGKNYDFPLSCWITRGGQCFFASNLTGQLFGKLSPIIYLQGVHDAGCILETYMRALSMITTRPLAGFMAYLVSRGFLVACLRTLAQLCNVRYRCIYIHTCVYILYIYTNTQNS